MATNIRANLSDFFGTTRLPKLEAVIMSKTESYASMIPIIFNQENMTTDIYQTTTISGLRNPTEKAENSPVTFQTIRPGYDQNYVAVMYATGYRISKEMVDDGKISLINRATESFSKGMFEIKELEGAGIFDDGFTTNGYDGVPLFSVSHPLENGNGTLGTNRPAAASELSLTSFRELRNIMQDTLNENGQRVKYMPSYFVLPQDLQDEGMELVKSQYNPENGNNAINTIYDSIKLLPGGFWNYLESTTAFFMAAEKQDHYLMFLPRQGMEVTTDYDYHAFAHEVIASERFDFGHSSWRGVVGNPGA